jgi:hypothetical protein
MRQKRKSGEVRKVIPVRLALALRSGNCHEMRGRLHEILDRMVDNTARDRAIYHALKAIDEVAAAIQAHLLEEHGADPQRAAAQSTSTNSLKLLRQARERLGEGLRAVEADSIAQADEISLRNR